MAHFIKGSQFAGWNLLELGHSSGNSNNGYGGYDRVRGYQEWLKEHELREERRAERQETFDFLRENGKDALDKALPELAKHQLFNVLVGSDSHTLAEQIAADLRTVFQRLLKLS